jgi:hypothetical protein
VKASFFSGFMFLDKTNSVIFIQFRGKSKKNNDYLLQNLRLSEDLQRVCFGPQKWWGPFEKGQHLWEKCKGHK